MPRYIEEEFIKAAMFHPLPYTHITPSDVDVESFKRGWNGALDAVLNSSQPADARENLRGEWTRVIDKFGINGEPVWKCSACKKMTLCKGDFCPNCGAYMRGEKNENR